MKALYDLKEKLCVELEEIAEKPDLSAGDLEAAHKLTDTIKNIDKIMMLEEGDGYSRDGDWEARGRFGHSYGDGGNSYARRGEHYVRGHYSRNSGVRMYSRDGGKKRLEEELEGMMQGTDGEHREIIRRTLEEIRNA